MWLSNFGDNYHLAYPELNEVGDVIDGPEWYCAAQESIDFVGSLKPIEKF
ncbi:MAG: hypothetical protein ACJA1S_000031 [Cellvibrionaceae bacterium]|jgi:hypothetical protein